MRDRLAEYRGRSSRAELRRDLGYAYVCLGLSASLLLVQGWRSLPSAFGWVLLGGGGLLVALLSALWAARAWSRPLAAAVLGAAATSVVVRTISRGTGVGALWSAALWVALALYLLHPSTAARFRAARGPER